MFKNEKFYVCEDVVSRDAVCKRLVENGGLLASQAGESNSVHVFNSFGGNLFDEYCKRGFRILGLQCIQDSLKEKKALPRSAHPIHSRILEGFVICGADIPPSEEKTKLKTLTGYMNGTWTEDVTTHTSIFLANEPGGSLYLLALEHSISVVQPSWINACWTQQALVETKQYLLPPLLGCIICVTGLSTSTRTQFQKLITARGGEYTGQLTRHCTHLLADKPVGRKYAMALTWGIPVVTTNWLFDSINLKGCADIAKYELLPTADIDELFMRPSGSRFGSHYPHSSGPAPATRRAPAPYAPSIILRRQGGGYKAGYSSVHPAPYAPSASTLPTIPLSLRQLTISNAHPGPVSVPVPQSMRAPVPSSSSSSSSTRRVTLYEPNTVWQNTVDSISAQPLSSATPPITYGSSAYRDMYNQLLDVIGLCDTIIEKRATAEHNINHNDNVDNTPLKNIVDVNNNNNTNNNNNNNNTDILSSGENMENLESAPAPHTANTTSVDTPSNTTEMELEEDNTTATTTTTTSQQQQRNSASEAEK